MTAILSAALFATLTIIGYQWLVIRTQRTAIATLSRMWLTERARHAAPQPRPVVALDPRHMEWVVSHE